MSSKRKSSTKQKTPFSKDPDSRGISASDAELGSAADSLPIEQPSEQPSEQPIDQFDEQLNNIGFVVELFLNDQRRVQLTQVLQVKSAEGEVWEGWDENRLIDFFVRQATLRHPSPAPSQIGDKSETSSLQTLNTFLVKLRRDFDLLMEQGKRFDLRVNKTHGFRAYIACEGESVPVEIPRVVMKDLDVETLEIMMKTALGLSLSKKSKAKPPEPRQEEAVIEKPQEAAPPAPLRRKAEVLSSRSESPCRVLRSGESFKLRFPLDRAVIEKNGAPLRYQANVAAMMWEDQSRRPLCQKAGVVQQTDETLLIEITEQELLPGVYRFKADLEFDSERADSFGSASLTSGFVQVV